MLKKFIGCLVGVAVGDALGSLYEGLSSLEFKFKEPKFLRWTDDTHMTIGVAESLIEKRGFDGDHMARTFLKNYEDEPWRGYAYGPPTIFRMIRSGVKWDDAAKMLFNGEGSYGNGGAMRVAPIGLFYHDDRKALREVAEAASGITHAHELGREGAVMQAYAVSLSLRSGYKSDLDPNAFLDELIEFTENETYREKLEMAKRLSDEKSKLRIVSELGNGIEAYNSVPTAIYSSLKGGFEESVCYAIGLGGDTDTIGAMTGAISGACYGIDAIPERWKDKLERGEYIEKLAEKLFYIKVKGE
jgi:poly(ADP-ribose) glycohydrolase ARH3